MLDACDPGESVARYLVAARLTEAMKELNEHAPE